MLKLNTMGNSLEIDKQKLRPIYLKGKVEWERLYKAGELTKEERMFLYVEKGKQDAQKRTEQPPSEVVRDLKGFDTLKNYNRCQRCLLSIHISKPVQHKCISGNQEKMI